MKNLFNIISDKNYYVNVAKSTVKNQNFQEMAVRNNLEFERVEAVTSEEYETTGRMLATYKAQNQSFANVFQMAIDSGLEKICIAEDDLEFTEDAKQVLTESLERTTERKYMVDTDTPIYEREEATGELTDKIIGYEQVEESEMIAHLPDNWDCFTLGCLNKRYAPTHMGGRVYKLRHASLGHLWFFKASMFQPMIDELLKFELPYDECISKVFSDFDKFKPYGILNKGIAFQRPGHSDNLEKYIDNSEVS